MEEQLINFETAKLAKEKGFNIPTRNFYADFTWKSIEVYSCIEVGYNEFTDSMENNHGFGDITLIPTQSLLQKWLREVHNIEVLISRIPPEAVLADKNKGKNILRNYNCYVWNLNSNPRISNNGIFLDIYEEALEAGLQEALKLI